MLPGLDERFRCARSCPMEPSGPPTRFPAAAGPFDSALYGDIFTTPEMHAVFDDRNVVGTWLAVEAAACFGSGGARPPPCQ